METFQCSMTSRRFQRKPWLLLIKKKKRKKKSWNYRVDVNIWNVEDAGAPLRVDLLRIGSRRAHQPARQRRPLPPRRRTLRSLAWVFCFCFFLFLLCFFRFTEFFFIRTASVDTLLLPCQTRYKIWITEFYRVFFSSSFNAMFSMSLRFLGFFVNFSKNSIHCSVFETR